MEGQANNNKHHNTRSGTGHQQQMQYVPVAGTKHQNQLAANEESKNHESGGGGGSGSHGRGRQQHQQYRHPQSGFMPMGPPGFGGMMNMNAVIQMPPGVQLPSLMTPQQKQEQFQAIQQKLQMKTSLTEMCDKHPTFPLIFEKKSPSGQGVSTKYCEKCFQDLQSTKDEDGKEDVLQEKKGDQIQTQQTQAAQPRQLTQQEKQGKVQELQNNLQNLLSTLSVKMQKKVDDLNLRYQQLFLYESTLNEKFTPLFKIMRQTVRERELDYMTYLLKQLDQNKDRVAAEKITLQAMMASYQKVADDMKRNLKTQLKNIDLQEKEAEKIVKSEETGEDVTLTAEGQEAPPQVNTYQVEALSTMIEDYENIITKNYCVYTNYEDFSFAESRSVQQLEKEFKDFVVSTFSGDYQIKNWFNQEVLPRIQVLQQGSKFINTYKILHNNTECQTISNAFTFPDRLRSLVTPEGHLYVTGGYLQALKIFLDNNFILDDHRSVLVPLQRMKQSRAEHAILLFKDHIYVFGGMSFRSGSDTQLQSLTSCESYSIKHDQWTEMPPMAHARQSFSACLFNEKYIFVFGGKVLGENATLRNMNDNQPFEFVSQVEVFEIEKNAWKVINYISENNKLRLINPGTFQVTGKKIIIFGGLKPADEENNQNPAIECGKKVSLSNETLFFNVTNGEIKSGPEMAKPSYYISGGNIFPQQGKIHAFGYTNIKDPISSIMQLSGEVSNTQQQPPNLEINPNSNKKTLHYYKVAEEEWNYVPESIFTGQRKMSMDTLDEAF